MASCYRILAVILLVNLLVGCSGPENRAVKLAKNERLFVALNPATIARMNQALGSGLENYGALKQDQVELVYERSTVMINGSEDLGVMVYTDEKLIPSEVLYAPMRPRQLFERVLNSHDAPLAVNSSHMSEYYFVTEAEIKAALPEMSTEPPLPLEIRKTL